MNENLLSKPNHGWTTFCLGDKEYLLSYLTCVPLDWLNAAIYGLEQLTPFVVHGFCEPKRFLCLVSYWNCHIIVEDEERESLVENEVERNIIHVSMIDFCKMLHADIKNNIDAWGDWNHESFRNHENAQKAINEMKAKINPLLDKLEELIARKEAFFGEDIVFC